MLHLAPSLSCSELRLFACVESQAAKIFRASSANSVLWKFRYLLSGYVMQMVPVICTWSNALYEAIYLLKWDAEVGYFPYIT